MNPNATTANPNPGNFGTIQGTFTFPEVSNLVQKTFADLLPQVPLDAKPLYISKTVGMGQGDSMQVNEQDFTTYASAMPEGTNAAKGQYGIGFHKQVLWYRYGMEYDITYKMRTTAQWTDVVADTARALATAVPQRMNLDMTHMITFGNAERRGRSSTQLTFLLSLRLLTQTLFLVTLNSQSLLLNQQNY
jgi:hypothetical protein